MGKLFTPEDILSGFQTTNSLNNNFTAIETALDACLSRTGETPNQMEADIDMNSNDLLNVGYLKADLIEYDFAVPEDFIVTSDNIQDGAVTSNKLADDSVGASAVNSDIVTQTPDSTSLKALEGLVDGQVVYLEDDGSGGAGLYTIVTSADPENAPYTFVLNDGHRAVLGGIPQNVSDLVVSPETGQVHSRETVTGGGSLDIAENLCVDDSSTYTLPDVTTISTGDCLTLITLSGAAPQVNTFAAEQITRTSGDVSSVTLQELSFYEFYWNGTSWDLVESIGETPTPSLNVTLDERALAVSNGDSIAPFTGDTGNLSVGTGELELTGTGSSVQLPMYTVGNEGLVFYGSIRSDVTTEYSAVRIVHENSADMVFFFNYNISSGSREAGTLSFRSRLSGGSTQDSKVMATGLDFTTNYKFVIEWTRPSGTGLFYVNFYDDNGTDLSLVNSGEAPGGTASGGAEITSFEVDNDSSSFGGTTYIQYLQASLPNFSSIGDSICAGHNNYDPDPTVYGGVDDYSSSWQSHLRSSIKASYPSLRNNFVYNRGVGGQDSSQILGRLDDLIPDRAPIVILGGPNNDYGSAISFGARTDNINQMATRTQNCGSTFVLLSSIVPNTISGSYPINAEYYDAWNTEQLDNTVADFTIDIMESGIRQSGEIYVDTTIATDGIHPNAAGYELIGDYIGTQLATIISV